MDGQCPSVTRLHAATVTRNWLVFVYRKNKAVAGLRAGKNFTHGAFFSNDSVALEVYYFRKVEVTPRNMDIRKEMQQVQGLPVIYCRYVLRILFPGPGTAR